MSIRRIHFPLTALLVAAAALAGCASPEESAGDDAAAGGPCAVASDTAGESGAPEGTTGSGTGDITTMDGGDPSRSADDPGAARECVPPADANAEDDGTSTGLGEPGGGFSTAEQ